MVASYPRLSFAPIQGFTNGIVANVIAALLMLVGSQRAFKWINPSFMQLAFFAPLALMANVWFSWLSAPSDSEFNSQGLISYLIWPMIMLVAGLVLAHRNQQADLALVPSILWLTSDSITAMIQSLLQILNITYHLPSWSHPYLSIVFTTLFIWQTLALLWIFAKRLQWHWIERLMTLVGTLAVLVAWQANIEDEPIWKALPITTTLTEQALYTQPALLTNQQQQLKPTTPLQMNWYFLGVAGSDSENVFFQEVQAARQLFDERFATADRSMLLVNNKATLLKYPVASKTSIERALAAISHKMNPIQDGLVIYISTHGLPYRLQLANRPLQLADIDPTWLKNALDAAKIKWRIIIISSCYSGSFINTLADSHTLIMTASTADAPSFGCSSDAELTFFGDALLTQGLAKESSLQAAFVRAKQLVATKEVNLGYQRSNPQWYMGDAFINYLPQIESSLLTPQRLIETQSMVEYLYADLFEAAQSKD